MESFTSIKRSLHLLKLKLEEASVAAWDSISTAVIFVLFLCVTWASIRLNKPVPVPMSTIEWAVSKEGCLATQAPNKHASVHTFIEVCC